MKTVTGWRHGSFAYRPDEIGLRNTEGASKKFVSLNGDMKSLKYRREINLLILIHRDSEGKRNLPEAVAKVRIRYIKYTNYKARAADSRGKAC